MSRWRYWSSCAILLYITIGLLHAQHHSIYIPNYLQAFDYPNGDETPLPILEQEHLPDVRFDEGVEPFDIDSAQTISPFTLASDTSASITTDSMTSSELPTSQSSSMSTFESSSMTSVSTQTTTMMMTTMTEQITTAENSTEIHSTSSLPTTDETSISSSSSFTTEEISTAHPSVNNTWSSFSPTDSPSTDNGNTKFIYREPIPPREHENQTTDRTIITENATSATTILLNDHDSEILMGLLNRSRLHAKSFGGQFDIYNTTAEEAARHFTDRKTMQSLIHLLPPNLWSQLQQNLSKNNTQYYNNQYPKAASLPDPIVLAEAAAQAGLPGPGPYPIPEHLWHQIPSFYRNPPIKIAQKIPITKAPLPSMTTIKTTKPVSRIFFKLPTTQSPFQPKPTTTSTTTTTTKTTSTARATFRPITKKEEFRTAPPFVPVIQTVTPPQNNIQSLLAQIGFTCPPGASGARFPDQRLCNMYFTCTQTGLPEPSLCPEGYLFSEILRDCEPAARVSCGSRLSAFFDVADTNSNTNAGNRIIATTQAMRRPAPPSLPRNPSRSRPNIVNGTLECVLGADGYFEDPLYCNLYHHCLAGVDYIEHCPNQLAWNEQKKMCDWTTNVNCTGKSMPVVQGKTTFCTNRQDGRYPSDTYCNAFHHCIGGIDHIVRCTGELQWDDVKKECGWESVIRCGAPKKMLPNENKFNSTFCTGKTDGSYPHEEYCNVYHVCESGSDNMRQCPHQLFWDNDQQKCEWSNNVRCTGRTLVALSIEASLFCMEKSDGFYIDPIYCNVYHQCMADIDVKLRCPERLIFNITLKRCDWPESSTCKGGNILLDGEENNGFCTDKPNGNYAHEQYCNRYYICQNGKDVVFTCQNNLRYSVEKNECDWAVNVDCKGKPDYMWEGIKENFCKRLPDGNYPDIRFCNIFHQCQAAMDYPKRCPNRLMFNEGTKECDWEDKVDCKGREKLIDTEGLDDEVGPGSNNTRGRSTKFCMVKENGDYADSYYCNVYHNCHGGFDTIQYCTRGLVWRQEIEAKGRCDWSRERTPDGADCNGKAIFFVEKLGETDILANLRSEFCISKGSGLFEHQRYCDLYLQCNEQGVGVTMECSPGLVFNEKKKECDYQADANDINGETKGTLCVTPRSFLRTKPKSEQQGSILFEGNDATGDFPTRFDCNNKDQQHMFADFDWCNIYHVCIGNRDNIFLCPPGTIFNDSKQSCADRLDGTNCNGTRTYYNPSMKRNKRIDSFAPAVSARKASNRFRFADLKQRLSSEFNDKPERIPSEWRYPQRLKKFDRDSYPWRQDR